MTADTKEQLYNIINYILNDYKRVFNRSLDGVSVVLTDNLWNTYYSLRPDHKNRLGEQLPDLHGTIVPPDSLSGNFTILIDLNYLLKDMNEEHFAWVGTIAHEYIHVLDFVDYLHLINTVSYDEILDKSRHYLFHLWTEFHARHHGYFFVRKYSFINMKDDSQVEFIYNEELPFQINNMISSYNSEDDVLKQLDAVAQFQGRLSVWIELFPNYFTNEMLKQIFCNNLWIYDMFCFLNSHMTLTDYIRDVEELKGMLKLNFNIK